MPGLSGRMSTVIKAKISHLLDRAEDPAETLDYSYEKQLEQLQRAKRCRRVVRIWRGRRSSASIWPRARCSRSTSRWRSSRTSSRS